jgi:hypothetical protein
MYNSTGREILRPFQTTVVELDNKPIEAGKWFGREVGRLHPEGKRLVGIE